MHKPAYVLENKTHNILSDFEIQTDPPVKNTRLDFN